MKTVQMTCGTCCGTGYMTEWISDSEKMDQLCTLDSKTTTCSACNGKGYTEYVVFTLDEAKAILKHCSLNAKD